MQTNTNKRRRQNIQNITRGRMGPSNIPQDAADYINLPGAPLPVSDLVRKVAESIRGGRLIARRDGAVAIIQKYLRFWFSEIGKLIRNRRGYLINNLSD